jgi:NAD(P)-dependent dehydrogenase (short-subunit alcohol dehydrogenase family)
LTARGAAVLAVIIDVSDPVAVTTLAARTLDHFGRVDLVVNNAGIAVGRGQPLGQINPQNWQRALAVNLLGVVRGIQAFMPHLVAAGAGRVVNIASLARLTASPFGAAYCASKHAVIAVAKTLHRELDILGLSRGVTVICPLVRTPLGEGIVNLFGRIAKEIHPVPVEAGSSVLSWVVQATVVQATVVQATVVQATVVRPVTSFQVLKRSAISRW